MLTRSAVLASSMAILVALGGYFYLQGRPHLVVVAQRVHDIDPRNPTPQLVLAVIFGNRSSVPIEITAEPMLHVRSVNTGGEQSVHPDRQSESTIRIPPGGSVELIYDLWQLTNLYGQGLFRELRDSPADMRFRLEVETDAGLCRSDEWANVSSGSDVGALLRNLRGGVAI
jgi:hypothetical protein